MQGLDVADAPLRGSECCSLTDDSIIISTTPTSADHTPDIGCSKNADDNAAVPSAMAHRSESTFLTARVALPLTPALCPSSIWHATCTESPASTATSRTPRWSDGSPLRAVSSPVVTFSPSTQFHECRQRTNVAVRRSSSSSDDVDELAVPAPLHDTVRGIRPFSLVAPSYASPPQQRQARPSRCFALGPAPVPPLPTRRFSPTAAAAPGRHPLDITDSSSDDGELFNSPSTESLSGLDAAVDAPLADGEEDDGDWDMTAAAAAAATLTPRPPPSLSLEALRPHREQLASSTWHLCLPAGDDGDDSLSDAEECLEGVVGRSSCAAAPATTGLHAAAPTIAPTPSPDVRDLFFTPLEPWKKRRPRPVSDTIEVAVAFPCSPQSAVAPDAGLPLCDSATGATAETVSPQLKCHSPALASPPSTAAAPLALDLDVMPHALLADLQLDSSRSGSASGASRMPPLPAGEVGRRVAQVRQVVPVDLTRSVASPVTASERVYYPAHSMHTSPWTLSCSTTLGDLSMSRLTDSEGAGNAVEADYGEEGASALAAPAQLPLPRGCDRDVAAETSKDTSANVSDAFANFMSTLNSQPTHAANVLECAICPKKMNALGDHEWGGEDDVDDDDTHEVHCKVASTAQMDGAPAASPLETSPPHPRRMELLCSSPLDVPFVSPREPCPLLPTTATEPTVEQDVKDTLELTLSPSRLPALPLVRRRSSIRTAAAMATATAAATSAGGGGPTGRNLLVDSLESLIKDERTTSVAPGGAGTAAHPSHDEDDSVAADRATDGHDGDASARVRAGETAERALVQENVSPTVPLENARGRVRPEHAAAVVAAAIVQNERGRGSASTNCFVDAVKSLVTPGAGQLPATLPFPHPPSTPSPMRGIKVAVECSPLPPRSLPTPRSLVAARHCLSLRVSGEDIGAGQGLAADGAWCQLLLSERSLATPDATRTASPTCVGAALSPRAPAPITTTVMTSTTTSPSVLSASLPPRRASIPRSSPLSPLETTPLPPPSCGLQSSSASSALPLSTSVPDVILVGGGSPGTATTPTTTTAATHDAVRSDVQLCCLTASSDQGLPSLMLVQPPQPSAPPPLSSSTPGIITALSCTPCEAEGGEGRGDNLELWSPPIVQSRPQQQQQQQRRYQSQRHLAALERSYTLQPLPPLRLECAPSTFQSLRADSTVLTGAATRDNHALGSAPTTLCAHDGRESLARRVLP